MKVYKGILLDIDNTILDFSKAEVASFTKTMEKHGILLASMEQLYTRYEAINQGYWKQFEKGLITKESLVIERFRDLFHQDPTLDYQAINDDFLLHLADFPYFVEGAKELLETLYGKFRLIAVTNGVASSYHRRAKASGIDRYFDLSIVSEEAGYSKPDVRFFTYAFNKAGLQEEDKADYIILGDSYQSDIVGGFNFGIDTCYLHQGTLASDLKRPTYQIQELANFRKIVMGE